MKAVALQARLRDEKEQGTRACRKLRQNGEIPGNLYGAEKIKGQKTKLTNSAIALSAYEVMQLIAHHQNVVEVVLGKNKKELAQIKEVQRDTFGDDVVHVDMEMIDATEMIQLEVEIVLKGDAKGVKEGGKMQVDLHMLEIECLPLAAPESIVVRVDDLEIGQAIHVSELQLPEGVTAVNPGDQLVLQIVEAVEEVEEGEDGEAAATSEPEVIAKGKPEDGA